MKVVAKAIQGVRNGRISAAADSRHAPLVARVGLELERRNTKLLRAMRSILETHERPGVDAPARRLALKNARETLTAAGSK